MFTYFRNLWDATRDYLLSHAKKLFFIIALIFVIFVVLKLVYNTPLRPLIEKQEDLHIAQRIYEAGTILIGVAAIIVTGIAVTIPIIIMSWSQVLDSTFHLITKVKCELKADLDDNTRNKMARDLFVVFEKTNSINQVARRTLQYILTASVVILLALMLSPLFPILTRWIPRAYDRGLGYYEFLGIITGVTLAITIPFIYVIILLMSAKVLNTKTETQIEIARALTDDVTEAREVRAENNNPSSGGHTNGVPAITGRNRILSGAISVAAGASVIYQIVKSFSSKH